LDTGAEANLLSHEEFRSIGLSDKIIKPTNCRLSSYGGTCIPTKGQCILYCKINKLCLPLRFFITEGCQKTILGLEACSKFNLIKKIGSVNESQFGPYQTLINSYEDIFEGLGCLPGKCHIHLRDNANPHVDPPRRVPFKLMGPYKDELARMEKLKVIEKVTEPTMWLNSVVLVSKPDNSIRVCLDARPLNREILRSRYPLPTLEELRSKMAGATVFSKLDASTAFWSMELDEESSHLCTFGTPFGRYRFLRLPYGICLAPEKFHQKWLNYFQTYLIV
jgi:hypothetical protein